MCEAKDAFERMDIRSANIDSATVSLGFSDFNVTIVIGIDAYFDELGLKIGIWNSNNLAK
jgi:hypothetical protein